MDNDKMKSRCEINENGDKYWVNEHEQFHREDGPAVEYANGNKSWYINGKLHREDGPASEYANGAKAYFIDGKFHREDGPAIEHPSGAKYWYYHGKHIKVSSQEAFARLLRLKIFW